MQVLLIRPEADSQALAERLAARGIESIVAPLLRIVPTTGAPDLAGVRALLFTSSNGVRAFAGLSPRRDLPVFAVGGATAAAAREAGFAAVASADGDGAALAGRVAASLPPGEGTLLHVSGADVAGDLAGALAARGHAVRRAILYRAEVATVLPAAAHAALAAGRIDGVPLFSPRSAEVFVRLVRDGGLGAALARCRAYCLSEAVARPARALDWRAVRVAAAPTADALIGLVAEDAGREDPPMTARPPADSPPADSTPAGRTPMPPAAPAHAPDARPMRLLVSAGLVALVVALAVAGTFALFAPTPVPAPASIPVPTIVSAPPAPTVDLAPIEARLGALERRPVVDTTPLSESVRRLQADVTPLSESIRRLQAEVTRLAERPTGDPALAIDVRRLEGALDALAKRLGTAETAIRDAALRERIGERALIVLGALRAAAGAGRPFVADLDAARAALNEDPASKTALDALGPHAAAGVPDVPTLARQFDRVAAKVVQAARRPSEGDLIDRTVERLASVVTVRRVDAPPAGTVDAAVAAAERALAAGDAAGALSALAPIREAVAAAAADWLAAAEGRREIDAALETLTRRVAAIVGGGR